MVFLASESNGPKILSVSLGQCEGDISSSDAQTIDQYASEFMAQGIAFFNSSGDHASSCISSDTLYPNTIHSPADSPHVVAVGGTELNVGAGNVYEREQWWFVLGAGGGFGTSQPTNGYFAEPFWQQLSLYPGAAGRSIPDVASDAFPGIVICQATPTVSPNCDKQNPVGGTSLGAPTWAAIWALTEQALVDAGQSPYSPANGNIYRTHRNAQSAKVSIFHPPSSAMGSGYDFEHVGLGSPDIAALVAFTVGQHVDLYTPRGGVGAGGTVLTLYGTGLVGVKEVLIGGKPATHLTVYSDSQLSVETPAAPSALAEIVLVTAGGGETQVGQFEYFPEITGVSPKLGPTTGGTTVKVTGRGLSNGVKFYFGTAGAATHVACSSSTECAMQTPAHKAAGAVDILAEVATPYPGIGPLTPADRFTYYVVPVCVDCVPK